jgi:Creatinine amidohydrolase
MIERPAVPGPLLPATTTTDHDTVHAAVAVLPVGAFEQHGPYLPLVADTLIASAITEAISQHHKIFQLPPITFGCSHEHSTLPGTVSLGPATLAAVVTDVSTSLVQQGISALIVVNGHGGNYVLGNVVQQLNADVRCASDGIRAARTGPKLARPPASAVATTTTCTPASSKRLSCSPPTRVMCVTGGRAMTTSPLIAAVSPPWGSVHIRQVV